MDKKVKNNGFLGLSWSAVTSIIIYTGLIFGGFSWMLNSQNKLMEKGFDKIESDFKTLRDNDLKHITDDIKELNGRFDTINARFDKMNERFDGLYQILLKDKKNSK